MDLLEVIETQTTRSYTNIQKAQHHLQSLPETSVRLDFHGVLDTLLPSQPLPSHHTYCVISFVGPTGITRNLVRQQIQERIETGQILFGVLVFQKGYTRQEKRSFIAPGGKAWVHAQLPKLPTSPIYFLDDHMEHIRSAQTLAPTTLCIHVQLQTRTLIETLQKLSVFST